MILRSNYTAPRIHVLEWLGLESLPPEATIREIIDLVGARSAAEWPQSDIRCELTRRGGYDAMPEIEQHYGIVQVDRWLRVVHFVTDANRQIALRNLPKEVGYRQAGDPWYEPVLFVLIPGANVQDPTAPGRGLDSVPGAT